MSPLDRHLTTEQLSALLDNQLSPEESEESYQAHLQTCEQCQQELAELRQTARLLREMPQPPLPRSFTLPATFSLDAVASEAVAAEDDRTSETVSPLPIRRIGQSILVAPRRRRLYTAIRLVGGLVAVLGIACVCIGLFTFMRLGGDGSVNSAVTSASQSGGKAATGVHYDHASPTSGLTPSVKQVPATQLPARATPTSKPASPERYGISSIFIFFDISTAAGIFRLGILLLVLIVPGFFLSRLLKKRSRLRKASSDQE